MKRLAAALLALLMLTTLICFTGCQKQEASFQKLEDFDNAVLGVVTGSLYDGYSRELFPNARVDYYQIFPDLFQCVKQGKVDGFLLDEPNFNAVKRTSPNLSCLDVPQYDVEIGYGFQKNKEGDLLQTQMNDLLNRLKQDGTVDRLLDKWYGDTEPTDPLPIPDFSDNPTKLRVAVDSGRKPFVYLRDGQYVGFEIEVMYLFCEEYGYNPQIEDVPFASGIAGLSAGKFDFVAGGLYMTAERKKSVNFSDPYMYADVVMVTCPPEESGNFFVGLAESFETTFLKEQRWKSILQGIGVTLMITVCSALFGSLLGFAIYMLCRVFGKLAKGVTKIFTVIMNGTPIVVVLMILYYVVFGQVDISGVIVSIIGFSFTTAAFVYENLTVTIDSIDSGQTEAALAMGFSDNGNLFHVLIPQAMRLFLPIYQGEMVSLVKATAVVGYIAVQDLTQASDIIRTNSYETFFPLIASALIYLLLCFLIARLLELIRVKTDPKNRKQLPMLKGVKQK